MQDVPSCCANGLYVIVCVQTVHLYIMAGCDPVDCTLCVGLSMEASVIWSCGGT